MISKLKITQALKKPLEILAADPREPSRFRGALQQIWTGGPRGFALSWRALSH